MRSLVKVAVLACGVLFLFSAREASASNTLFGWTYVETSQGTLPFGYTGVNVKFCTNNNGTGSCYSTTTFYNCYAGLCGPNWYQLTVPDGSYYIFLYDNTPGNDFGSDSSPSKAGFGSSCCVGPWTFSGGPIVSVFNITTAVAPHRASAIYPTNGQDVPSTFTLKWTNGSDAYRSGYAITYDVYGKGEGGTYILESSQSCNPDASGYCQLALSNIKSNTKYYWYVVSKINPGYYAPNPYYTRQSSEFNFTTQVNSSKLNSFQTYSQSYYLSAAGCGGGALNAQAIGQGSCESFKIIDLNGGSIMSGDTVNVQLGNLWYVVAEGGGGGDVNVNRTSAGPWETFTIEKLSGTSGSRILHGDHFALRTYNGNYISAVNGGGSSVNAIPTQAITWENFSLNVHD